MTLGNAAAAHLPATALRAAEQRTIWATTVAEFRV